MANGLTGHYRVLLIEDNPLDAELAADRLRAGGLSFDVRVVDSRAKFDEAFREGGYDLILADYSLPDFDGLTALEIVRAVDKRVPFVFVSGVLGEDVAVETLLRGATDYVLKQKLERLVPAVTRALTEHAEFRQRQRAEMELRRGEEEFAQLTNSLPAMVWTCDRDGRLTFTNKLWETNIGEAEFLFDPKIIHPRDLASCSAAWREALASGKPFELDCRFRMKSGEYRWQLVWAAPVEDDDGNLTGWVGTCTDTEQQRTRDVQLRTAEKLALTGRMSSVIAHEINNPLEAMTNLLYLLRAELNTDKARGYLAQVEHELMRISAITKLTLQWSREEGTMARLSARAVLEESQRLFAGKLRNKNIALHTHVEEDVYFPGVGGEVRQVLANLLSNAIDAVEQEGRIDTSARRVTKSGTEYVEFCVKDNGPGIDAERLPGLFVPFRSTKGNLGNGLGLYISKEIVDRNKGELTVDSKVGEGTTMRVLLPVNG